MKKEKVFEMKLTHEEKKMLDGYEGPARQKAMELFVLTGSCPSTRGYPAGVRTAAYDSAKQRMSAAQETDATLFYGSRQECLQSAVSGFWEGR